MFDSFVSDEKITICFHKSCVDGLFSVIVLLECLEQSSNVYDKYTFQPLTPTEVTNQTPRIKQLMNKKKIILDLPYFGSQVQYYFDHHITNTESLPTSEFSGLLDISAASTCSVLKQYFQIPEESEIQQLITIADVVDQAQFTTPPPAVGPIQVSSLDDKIWACNDLIKDVRDETTLLELLESFDKKDFTGWITHHQQYITNYRKRRQESLNIKHKLQDSPILIIKNESRNIQAEGLHFSLAAENPEYKMLILIDKINKFKKVKTLQYRIAFRLNPKLNEEETNTLRVDTIAHELGGGGHKGAASATITSLQSHYGAIISWVASLGLEYSEYQF